MSLRARKIVDALLEMKPEEVEELPAPYLEPGQNSEEIEHASRHPFNAMELASRTKRHIPKLWKTIKGSPFERKYREMFRPQD